MSERQEHVLSWRRRLDLRLHLLMCVSCRRFERQLGTIRKGLRRLGRDADAGSSDGLTPEARERIRSALTRHRDHGH